MEGCAGCFTSVKGQARELEVVKAEAKKYAVANGKTVAIYKEGEGFGFIEADKAEGIAILGYISQFDRNAVKPVDGPDSGRQ